MLAQPSTTSISVVMPCYNGADNIRPTLDSYLGHDLDKVELVIVNDGSTDNSSEVITQYQDRLPIKFIDCDNAGQSAATNRGIEASSGELIWLTCQDIRIRNGHFERLRTWYREKPGKTAVLGPIDYPQEILDTSLFTYYLEIKQIQFSFRQLVKSNVNDFRFFYAPNLTFRRQDLEDLRGFHEELPYGWQDTELGVRFLNSGGQLFYDRERPVWHDHPTTFESYLKRQKRIGGSFWKFIELHGETAEKLCMYQGKPMVDVYEQIVADKDAFNKNVDLVNKLEKLPILELEKAAAQGISPLWGLRDSLFQAYTSSLFYSFCSGLAENKPHA